MFWKNQFMFQTCTVIAKIMTTFPGGRKFLDENSKKFRTKAILLTGAHGYDDGKDGLEHLECLSPGKQTRYFYVEWLEKYLGAKAEGEDPRVCDAAGNVIGIKDDCSPPDWRTIIKQFSDHEVAFKVSCFIFIFKSNSLLLC